MTSSERRDGPRIDLRLRVRYTSDADVHGEAEASDVSPRGLRFESETAIPSGIVLDLRVDNGDDEELTAQGNVTWCTQRLSPTGKTMYDIGVHFENDWLAQDRGPLGAALAKIFSMNHHEPARSFERTQVDLSATGSSSNDGLELAIGDLSAGGMFVQLKGSTQEGSLHRDLPVQLKVEFGDVTHIIKGRVAWLAGDQQGMGVQFLDVALTEQAMLEAVSKQERTPDTVTISLG